MRAKAERYAAKRGRWLLEQLGGGVQGVVWLAADNSNLGNVRAVKLHEREGSYARERDAYLRLQEVGLVTVRGCSVPQLLHHDDPWRAIQMTVVGRPYVLDFADAWLDAPPDLSVESWRDWERARAELFGDRWPEVLRILAVLGSHGVFMLDPTPSNIALD